MNSLKRAASPLFPMKTKEVKTRKLTAGSQKCTGNFILMVELRKKILIFRDITNLPPIDDSTPIIEIVLRTVKDIHNLCPEIIPNSQYSEPNGAGMDRVLIHFYEGLRAIGDSWISDPEWIDVSRYTNNGVGKNKSDRVAEYVLGALDGLIKHTREKIDKIEQEDDRKKHPFQKSGSVSDSSNSFCNSPVTPRSVLPELKRVSGNKNSGLWSLRARSLEKLSPADVKRLTIGILTQREAELGRFNDNVEELESVNGEQKETTAIKQELSGSDVETKKKCVEENQSEFNLEATATKNESQTPFMSDSRSGGEKTAAEQCQSETREFCERTNGNATSTTVSGKETPVPTPPQVPIPAPPLPPPLPQTQPPAPQLPPPPAPPSPSPLLTRPPEPRSPVPPAPPTPQSPQAPPLLTGPPEPPSPLPPQTPPPPPPPLQVGKGASAPPPPPPGVLRCFPTKKPTSRLKRSVQIVNLYRLLKGKVDGHNVSKNSSSKQKKDVAGKAATDGKSGMADALAEMTKRSAYFQHIEEDVRNYAKTINSLKLKITKFQTKDMTELVKFHDEVESFLENLTDETQVLARFEGFPEKKLEALRMASSLYTKLNNILTELHNWKINTPLDRLLDNIERHFAKIKEEVDGVERSKDEEAKVLQSHNLNVDFNTILLQIKESMVDVSSNCMEMALKEKRETKKAGGKMLWRAFQFAFRVYSFAGGQDDRADHLTKQLADEIQTDPQSLH